MNNTYTIVSYPFVKSNSCIHGVKVIINFVHQEKLYIPTQIIVDSSVQIIIVVVNSIFRSEILARKHIKHCLRRLPKHVRIILPLAFSRYCPIPIKDRFEYCDIDLDHAVR